MTISATTSISPEDRSLLARLADELIPAADGMLSASQAEVHGVWLDTVLQARPDLVAGLQDMVSRAKEFGEQVSAARLRASDAKAFDVLTEVVTGAYFLNPDVRQAIGYAGQTAHAIDHRKDYLDDSLLDSVISRGSIYRPTPRAV